MLKKFLLFMSIFFIFIFTFLTFIIYYFSLFSLPVESNIYLILFLIVIFGLLLYLSFSLILYLIFIRIYHKQLKNISNRIDNIFKSNKIIKVKIAEEDYIDFINENLKNRK